MKDYYICRYHLNASHSNDGSAQRAHFHTFLVEVCAGRRYNTDKDIDISEADRLIHNFLERYEGKFLNELEEFSGKNASLEDIGDCFFEILSKKFEDNPFEIYEFSISDNPLSGYRVSDRILLPIMNMDNSTENYNSIIEQKKSINSLDN
jgi:6-pyruvoyl-tetrahydropterin synthase